MQSLRYKALVLFSGFSCLFSCFPLMSNAANVAVNGVGVRGHALQAFTAVADDPSAIYYNPAGITQLSGTRFDNEIELIIANAKYRNTLNATDAESRKKIIGGAFFASVDKFKPIYLGFGVYAPFARKSSVDANAAVLNLSNDSSILRLDFVPTIAYLINPSISVAASLVVSRVTVGSSILGLAERGLGYGVTGQCGVLASVTPAVKVGVDYRGPMNARVSGHGNLLGVGNGNFVTYLRFPGTVSAGVAWQVNEPWLVSLAYEYEMWSYMQRVVRNYNVAAISAVANNAVNGKDVGNWRVGVRYHPQGPHEYYGGYGFLPAAVPAVNILPSRPDYDTHLFTVGYSYYKDAWRFDTGYEFAYAPKRFSNSPVFPGNYSMNASTVMFNIGYTMG